MSTSQSNFVFGIEGRDLSLGAELDALAAKVQAFGRDATTAFQAFSTGLNSASSAGQKATQATTQVAAATDKAANSAKSASSAFGTLKDKIVAIGEGLIIYKAFEAVESIVGDLAKSIIALPAAYEQSEIAFKNMLGGDAQAADAMLQKLQTLANITPFRFGEEQDAARTLLGLGQSAEKILPELVDVDTAVAAVGGNEDQVQRVAAALGKMSSEGRVSAVFMNELTRDGIPAWNMLSEEMGVSVSKLREMSQNGEIASSVFEKAFHDYTIKHWGDVLGEQSQTFQGLISTAQDLFDQFTRVFGMPIIQELEPKLRGAVQALQDPNVIVAIEQWGKAAADFAGHIFDAVTWLAQLLGLPLPQMSTDIQSASEAVKQFQGDWSSTNATVDTTKQQISDLQGQLSKMRDDEAEVQLSYEHQIAPLQRRVTLLDRAYERENALANLAVTQDKVARDKALAVDIYSEQGRAAAERLPEEQAQLAAQQRGIAHDAAKAGLDDQIYALQQQEKAQKESYDRQERALQAQIDRMQKAQTTPTPTGTGSTGTTKPARTAADAFADYEKSLDQGQLDLLRKARAKMDQDIQTMPPPTGLFDKIFGTADQQQAAGQGLADQFVKGFGTAIHEWALGHGSDAMKLLMGGDDLGDAVHRWIGEVGGVENLGAELAHAMFPDWPGLLPWLQQQMAGSGITGGATPAHPDKVSTTGPNTLGGGDVPGILKDVYGTTTHTTQVRQRRPPNGSPVGHGKGYWQAGKSYTDGTTDWTFVDGAIPETPQPQGNVTTGGSFGPDLGPSGGGDLNANPRQQRALGGSVNEGWYTVGENGPEWLHAGGSGYVTPNGGGGGGGSLGTIQIEHLCPRCLRLEMDTYMIDRRDHVMKQVAISARNNR